MTPLPEALGTDQLVEILTCAGAFARNYDNLGTQLLKQPQKFFGCHGHPPGE
jgi:hypothetical protein